MGTSENKQLESKGSKIQFDMSTMCTSSFDSTDIDMDGDKDEDLIVEVSSHIAYEENEEIFPGTRKYSPLRVIFTWVE